MKMRFPRTGRTHGLKTRPCSPVVRLGIALLSLLAAAAAQANITVGTISQSPQNPVTPGQAVSFSLPVSSDASGSNVDFVSYTVSLNGTDIGTQFTPASPCSHDGSTVYCNGNGITASTPQTYQVTWNNPAPQPGSYQLTFQVNCSSASGAPCAGGTATVTTIVSAPPVANDDSAATQTGKPVSIDVLANDSGPVGVTFGIVSVTAPNHGSAVIDNGTSITYTSAAGFVGTDTFDYTIRNADGATASATVTVTVTSATTVTAVADAADTQEGAAVTVNVLSNDQVPSGQSIAVTAVSQPAHGTAVNNGDGTITYTPDNGFSGTDSFDYTVMDSSQQTSTATVTVNVKSLSRVGPQATTGLHNIPGLTPNQYSIAVAIDRYCADSTSAQVQSLCQNLDALSASDQVTALQQIAPQEVASQGTSAFITSYTQLANVRMRLLALRQGAAGLSVNNLSLGVQGEDVPLGRLLAALIKGANGGGASADGGGDDRLGVFLNGRVNFGNSGTTVNETGFNFDTLGVTAGADYRFSDRLVAGGALGFASTSNEFAAGTGNMSARDLSISTYGSYYLPKDMFVDWIATYVNNHYDINHNIVYSGFNASTSATTGGDQLALAVNAGRDFHHGGLLFTPYARVEYIATGIDAYREGNGSGLAVAIDHQSMSYLTSVLAGRLSKAMSVSWGVLSPSVHAEWVHQYDNGSRLIGGHFVGDPNAAFAVRTDGPDRDYFNIGFGLVATLPRGMSGFFNYETVVGRNHVRNTLMQLGARVQF